MLLVLALATLISVDVDEEKLATEQDLTWSTTEPIGLEVPTAANEYWLQIGCAAGDIIDRIDGAPASTFQSGLREGVHYLELRRRGKPVLLRLVVHGPMFRTQHLKADDAAKMVDQLKDIEAGALAAPVKRGGVRVVAYRIPNDTGLEPGDVVRTVDGARVESEPDLRRVLSNIPIGHSDVIVERDGRTITITWEREP